MAIYHLHVKNISRGDGRSAVAAAAYRAGETLPNEIEERESAFGGRRDVLHAEVRLPPGAPAWMADRARLWNGAEAAERRKDARLAKEIEVALPRELTPAVWLHLARQMADAYTSLGHVVDLAIHENGTGHNPHLHLMLTTRAIVGDGFGGKMRVADGLAFVTEARARWAVLANAALAAAGISGGIDPRSHAAAGRDAVPTRHRGPDPAERQAARERAARMTKTDVRDLPLVPPTVVTDDRTLPVPNPQGELITQDELERAETAMVAEVERDLPDEALVREWWAVAPELDAPEPDPEQSQEPQRDWWR